jgi:hypothetical protein
MRSVFRPTTVHDEAQIVEFLTRVFAAEPDAPFVNPSLLRWKYWEPRADCPDPRSFVMDRDGLIVAHVGLWPVTAPAGATRERGVQMIDWASDPQAPGAGVSLLQRLTKSYDFVYSIGGSEMTQSILPKFGFHAVAEALTWARPIRPWRQALHHQSRDLRLPLRLARNLRWSWTPARRIPHGWASVESGPDAAEGVGVLACERDASFFEYLRRCPAAPGRTFHIVHDGRIAGYFALSMAGEQARVAGLWLEDPSAENWRVAFNLAQQAALRHSLASEIVVRCASASSAAAAGPAGMRLRARTPVFLFRRGSGAEGVPLQFQLCDDDAVFLRGRLAGFLT